MPADAILLGDFNFEWDASEYARIVGPATTRYGRLNRLTGFVDAWVAAGHREDEGATIPAIAKLLGVNAVTIRWHLSRGRKELATWISKTV